MSNHVIKFVPTVERRGPDGSRAAQGDLWPTEGILATTAAASEAAAASTEEASAPLHRGLDGLVFKQRFGLFKQPREQRVLIMLILRSRYVTVVTKMPLKFIRGIYLVFICRFLHQLSLPPCERHPPRGGVRAERPHRRVLVGRGKVSRILKGKYLVSPEAEEDQEGLFRQRKEFERRVRRRHGRGRG